MTRVIILKCYLVLLLLTCASDGFAQTNVDGLRLTISVDKTTFVRGQKVKARVKAENQTGQTLNTGRGAVSFHLEKYTQEVGDCRLTECYGAVTYWFKKLKDRKTYDLGFDLADLHWADSILSGKSLSRPKNLFKEVPFGEYYLLVTFQFPDEKNSTKGTPRPGPISSNKILIKLEGNRS